MQVANVAFWPKPFSQISHLHVSSSLTSTLSLSSPPKLQTHVRFCSLTPTTSSSHKAQQKKKKKPKNHTPYPHRHHAFLEELYTSSHNRDQNKNTQKEKLEGEALDSEKEAGTRWGIFTNMWWAELKAALGQRLNLEGIAAFGAVVARDRHLAVPHVAVLDVSHVDWGELRRKGFKGVVFDKDNTLTVPYSLTLWGSIRDSVEECKSVFGSNVAIFSNSAGLQEYDLNGCKAAALEKGTGIKVIRHRVKKPSGDAEEIEKHFGCVSSHLVMVGDRHFTDIVYGNRNGFLTILSEPLSLAEEPFIITQVRRLEVGLVNGWCQKGLKPSSHSLMPDPLQCVKDSWHL